MDCIAIQSPCPRHRALGVRGALGWACAGVGAQQAQAWMLGPARGARTGAGSVDRQTLGVQGRAERRACDKQARGQALGAGGRRARGRARQARGLATGCALGALGLFSYRFDSVFFLSQFLDIVRELGS